VDAAIHRAAPRARDHLVNVEAAPALDGDPTSYSLLGRAVRSSDAILNESIVVLSITAQVAYGFVALKGIQTVTEVLLLVVLGFAISRLKFDAWELLLLWAFMLMTAISLLINDVGVFLTDAKIYGVCILTLLYFSKVHFKSRVIWPVFVVNLLMYAVWKVSPGLLMPLASASRSEVFNQSRFGGFFLNAHYTAYFMAIAFIYYGYKRPPYAILGLFVIFWTTASKFVVTSYAANLATRLRLYERITRHLWLVAALTVVVLYLLWQNQDAIVELFNTTTLLSGVIILQQLFDPRFYAQYLGNPVPSDATLAATEGLKVTYLGLAVGNEIALFTMFIQGGFLLATLYLGMLLRNARYYRVFILVSILHYGFVTSSLIIYMLLTYSREIDLLRETRSRSHDEASTAPASIASLPGTAL